MCVSKGFIVCTVIYKWNHVVGWCRWDVKISCSVGELRCVASSFAPPNS